MATKLRSTLASLAGGALAVAALGVAPAGAATPTGTSDDVASKGLATTKGAQSDVRSYWTPTRMRNAVPAGPALGAGSASASADVARGEATSVAATAPATQPKAKPQPAAASTGDQWSSGGQVVSTTGKVFFTMDGTNYVCSGSATSSSNRDVVTTAGHCVKDGSGSWATNWAFVPAYDDGDRPYGTFTARELTTTSQWASSGDFDYDVGMAVMGTLNGDHLTDTVGGQGIAFNQARGEEMYAFGYPAAKKYDGSELVYCNGVVFDDTYGGSNDQGMDCDMTGGSSGGPWLRTFDGSTGQINSVNSFGYRGVSNVMWGPYFGSTIQSLYGNAQSL